MFPIQGFMIDMLFNNYIIYYFGPKVEFFYDDVSHQEEGKRENKIKEEQNQRYRYKEMNPEGKSEEQKNKQRERVLENAADEQYPTKTNRYRYFCVRTYILQHCQTV
jgi:hypothetical protein